jgi:hypothetical protein
MAGLVFCNIKMTDTSNEYYRTLNSLEEARLYTYNWTYYTPDSVIEKFEKEYKTSGSWYSVEDLVHTEIMDDPGPALALYNDAWFNSIRVK